jgi:O-antigen biosynthesis protein
MSQKLVTVLNHNQLYDETYYKENCGGHPYERSEHWTSFFNKIARQIADDFKPAHALDAGCAIGLLVEALRKNKVDAVGFDISEWAIEQMPGSNKNYVKTGSILDFRVVDKKFDLVTCIEVLEHLQPSEADIAIRNLCSWGDLIIFSSSPDDFKETTHFNVQQPGYWAEKFLQNGFVRLLDYDASYICSWAQVFRRQSPVFPSLVRQYENNLWTQTNQIHSQREQLIKFEHDLNKQKHDAAWYRTEFKRLVGEIEAHETIKQHVVSENQSLKEKLEVLELKSEALEEKSKTFNEKFEAVELQAKILKESNSKIFAEQKNLQKSYSDLQIEAAALKQTNDELAKQNQQIYDQFCAVSDHLEKITNTKSWRAVSFWWKNKHRTLSWVNHKTNRISALKKSTLIIWRNQGSAALAHRTFRFIKGERNSKSLIPFTPPKVLNDLEQKTKILETLSDQSIFEQWIKENEPDQAELELQRTAERNFSYRPLISVLTPVYNTDRSMLTEMLESVLNQTYSNWELCLVDGCSTKPPVREVLEEFAARDNRFKVRYLKTNHGISGNSNEALEMVTGEFTALLDHDDILSPNAFYEIVKELNKDNSLDFLYSDKDMITEDGRQRFCPLFKPQWSPDILFNTNYLTHLNVIRTKILHEIGGFDAATDGAQDWDLFVRVCLKTERIRHIPYILYHWRFHQESVASGLKAKPYAADGQILAVKKYLKEKNIDAAVEFSEFNTPRIVWQRQSDLPVSIVIDLTHQDVSCAVGLVSECLAQTLYSNIELIIINRSGQRIQPDDLGETVKVIDLSPETASGLTYQKAVEKAAGDVLVFLSADLISPDFGQTVHELVSWTQFDEIGVVGGMLVSPEGTVATTGLVFDQDGQATQFGSGLNAFDSTPLGHLVWYRNFSAIPHHCMAVRKDVIKNVNGFDETLDADFQIDFCLRLSALKLRHLYTPHAVLQFQQTPSNDLRIKLSGQKIDDVKRKHNSFFQNTDPYFNPHLTCCDERISLSLMQRDVLPRATAPANAPSSAPSTWEFYSQEAACLSTWLDVNHKALQKNKRLIESNSEQFDIKSITWFLPEFQNAFYGGVHTILRFAAYLKDHHGITNRFVIVGNSDSKKIQSLVETAFPSLAKTKVITITSLNSVASLPKTDAAVCTLWSTAYYQMQFNQTRRKFYFIQDYEPAFYPAGSTSGQVEATYRFGYYGITNTVSLKTIYERDYDGQAEYFTPSTNSAVFYPPDVARPEMKPFRIFFYVRPGHPRNAFELGMSALRILKSKMQDEIEIITAGSDWKPEDYNLQGVIKNYGLIKYEETGDLYRTCHAGMAMMFTRHPSYIPFELMACKSLVVTNHNSATKWLFKDEENCLLSEASATAIAETVERGVRDVELRHKITENAYRLIEKNHYDWNSQIEKIYRYMCAPKSSVGK